MKYRITPYMHDSELKYLEDFVLSLPEKASIAEWGSGGSTTMFTELLRPNQNLISVEHDEEWASKVSTALDDHPNKDRTLLVNVYLQKIEMRDDHGNVNSEFYERYKKVMMGQFLEENPCFLDNYIDPTRIVPMIENEKIAKKLKNLYSANMFFVDGLARGATLATIRVKAKKGSVAFLHDYVGRQNQYDWAVSLFSKREVIGNSLLKLTI